MYGVNARVHTGKQICNDFRLVTYIMLIEMIYECGAQLITRNQIESHSFIFIAI